MLNPRSTIFFICDVQTKFRPAIHGFDEVIATTNKMLRVAQLLGIEVVVTTQNARALGPTDPTINLSQLGPLHLATIDKSLFSMWTPEVSALLQARPNITSVVLLGIETHVCILQTALSLLSLPTPYTTYVVADGTSSSNSFEPPIAFARLRDAGAIVGTSESLAFELVGDAGRAEFKAFSRVVKEEKEGTKRAGDVLLKSVL